MGFWVCPQCDRHVSVEISGWRCPSCDYELVGSQEPQEPQEPLEDAVELLRREWSAGFLVGATYYEAVARVHDAFDRAQSAWRNATSDQIAAELAAVLADLEAYRVLPSGRRPMALKEIDDAIKRLIPKVATPSSPAQTMSMLERTPEILKSDEGMGEEPVRRCSNCGVQVGPSSRYCYSCGANLHFGVPQSADPPEAAQRSQAIPAHAIGELAPLSPPLPQAHEAITPLPAVAIRRRPAWVVILLMLFSFGLYFPVWFGQTWSELKRIVRDSGMSPFWHALTLFVPLYNLYRVHAHFRTINAQSARRALPRKIVPGIAVAGVVFAFLLGRTTRYTYEYVTAYSILSVSALLIGVILAIGQSALNRVWEHDFGGAAEHKAAAGEWIALIVLGILFARSFSPWGNTALPDVRIPASWEDFNSTDLRLPSSWEDITLPELKLPSSWGFEETFDRSTSVPEDDPSVVVRTATDDGLVVTSPASADKYTYLIYRDSTQDRNFAFRVDVGPTTGRGAIILVLTTPNEDDRWTVFVDPAMHQWGINEWHSGMEYDETRVEPVTYPSSGPVQTIEVRVNEGRLSVFVNGKDVSAGHTRAMSQLPSDLFVGYGAWADSQARDDDPFTVTFKGVSLREIK